MLARFLIKKVTSTQLKEVVESCGRASFIISPSEGGLWTISVCLRASELDTLKNKGYSLEKTPG
jgi:hypothetical protein